MSDVDTSYRMYSPKKNMNGDAQRAKEAGCNDYLTKPVDEVLLLKILKEYLK